MSERINVIKIRKGLGVTSRLIRPGPSNLPFSQSKGQSDIFQTPGSRPLTTQVSSHGKHDAPLSRGSLTPLATAFSTDSISDHLPIPERPKHQPQTVHPSRCTLASLMVLFGIIQRSREKSRGQDMTSNWPNRDHPTTIGDSLV